ncbi:MAG: class I SAM-dependent methyltransferase [Planctomycetaceae bacterium]|jgi:2-polyprenyl-3-methyl-5-hydroxy-6-metoxy-1,4-benzoquinol methylase|nr:class I SAM-dependent methyltransferase [Planctomycetaceae bacterium]
MAFVQIESDNPNFSFLIRKNPASGMLVKQLRQGLLFGYYSKDNPTQFNCWFKDHDAKVSYDANKEFEFNDVTRYSAASFVTNCFDEFFHDLTAKDQENDTLGFNNSLLINCIHIKKRLLRIFNNSFRDFDLNYEPLTQKFFRVRIRTNQTLRKLLCYTNVLALVSAIDNREIRFADDRLLLKYAKFIQFLDAPYFIRYLFKTNLIRREETFFHLRPFLETETIKLSMGYNYFQRSQFIEQNLVGSVIIDVGCGEGYYLRFAKKVEKYYAIDRDENCLEQCRHRIKHLELDNVELLESLDELPTISVPKTLLLTEVIEHNTQEDAFELVRRCLLPETRIIITTPNRDFNVNYCGNDENNEQDNTNEEYNIVTVNENNGKDEQDENTQDESNFRHKGHVFEFCDAEFRNFILQTVVGSGAKVTFFQLGDQVDGVTPQSAAIIENY